MRCLASVALCLIGFTAYSQGYTIEGELKKWHKVTIEFTGPQSSENADPNPFMDYKLEVEFTNGNNSQTVQGYFAADGNAAETGATSGDKWVVHFAPDTIGTWSFTTSFYEGTDVAVGGDITGTGILHNVTGSFSIAESDKTGRDLRGRGRLSYVGEKYLQFAEDQSWFYKVGADAPENTLAYEDFDATPNRGNRRKDWSPHQQDYDADSGNASQFTWQNGKGSELLGVVNYLATKEVNVMSFLTFSLSGDDENVFPHLLKVDIPTYNGYNDNQQWNDGVHHDRFDVSKMAQWERIFSYADQKGIYLHFKTQETENDQRMDGGDTGRERKAYYRELVARFGHHLALNWNTGEENTQTAQQEIDMAAYLAEIDPYGHHIVMHTYPGQHDRYFDLLGDLSEYTGASMQTSNNNFLDLNGLVETWNNHAANAGQKWVIAVDEPGNAGIGTHVDPNDVDLIRHRVIWGILMGGGAGVEFYYGYNSGCGDLLCQDHRTRDSKYTYGAHAIKFFDEYLQGYLPNVTPDDDITADNDDYVLTNNTNMITVFRPDGGTTDIDLFGENAWFVNWYDPMTGVMDSVNAVVESTLTAPDNGEWVAILHSVCPPTGSACNDSNPATVNDTINDNCQCFGTPIIVESPLLEAEFATVGSKWSVVDDSMACRQAFTLPPGGSESLNSAPPNPSDHIRFSFALEAGGVYKVFARVLTTNDSDDSFWVRANSGAWQKWNKINFPYDPAGYQWSQVGNWTSGDQATPVTFNLNQGLNTVDFAWREPGARLDKIFVTPEDLDVLNKVRIPDSTGRYSYQNILEEACPNDVITFEPALDTVLVGSDDVLIEVPLTIVGNGMDQTAISGGGMHQLFINESSNLVLRNLSLINGFAATNGGAFVNTGQVTLENVRLKNHYEGGATKAFTNNGSIKVRESSTVSILDQ